METLDSFERMATGLTTEERKNLLKQLKASESEIPDEIISSINEKIEEVHEPIAVQIKKESLFFRFVLWLKSVFTSTK